MNPLRRDDVDMETIEQIQKMFPGMEIVFAGNSEHVPEEVQRAFQEIAHVHEASLARGECIDCGKLHARPWPPKDRLRKGWARFTQGDEIVAIQCPKCNDVAWFKRLIYRVLGW